MSNPPRVAFVGIGETEFARVTPEKSKLRLEVEAAKLAIDDAGLALSDIDGVLVWNDGNQTDMPRYHIYLSEVLGIHDKGICLSTLGSGSSSGTGVELARWALQAGRCRYVLCVGSMKGSEYWRIRRRADEEDVPRIVDGLAVHLDGTGQPSQSTHSLEFELPYGPFGVVSYYGAMAQRHMYEYGTTIEQISAVSVAARYNASLNPAAVYRVPLTVADVLASPLVASPLHALHCCVMTDGAVAFVLTTEERARDLRHRPVYIQGAGAGHSGYYMGFLAERRDDGTSLTQTLARRAADEAFGEAGVARADIDFVTCLDNFAITPLVLLEDLGFCAKGDGGPFVGEGDGARIRVGGALPVNPHGGAMSCNHAGINYQNYTEATRQLRGQGGDRQVGDAQLACVHSGAGVASTHHVAVLTRE